MSFSCSKYLRLFWCSRGVPAVVDFAAMRDAISRLGGDPDKINPVCPADLVIDHSVEADLTRRYNHRVHIRLSEKKVFIIIMARFFTANH